MLSPARKILILVFLLLFSNLAFDFLVGPENPVLRERTLSYLFGLFLMCIAHAWVIFYLMDHTAWRGVKLAVAVWLLYFGVTVFLTQIEVLIFLDKQMGVFSTAEVIRLSLSGFLVSALFAIAVYWVAGEPRVILQKRELARNYLPTSPSAWSCRLAVVSVTYLVIYFLFGAFVFMPLAGPAFKELYGNLSPPSWLLPICQLLRGLLWASLAVLVIRMSELNKTKASLLVGALFAILMGALIFPPNNFMPERIRFAHLVEIFGSNFIFGLLAVRILTKKKTHFSGG